MRIAIDAMSNASHYFQTFLFLMFLSGGVLEWLSGIKYTQAGHTQIVVAFANTGKIENRF